MTSRDQLEAALEPVRDHYRGKELTDNTVLAAHMRAIGIPPSGDPWKTAQASLRSGKTFEDAALAGGGHEELGVAPLERPAPKVPVGYVAGTEMTPERMSGEPLDWFPQRFQPGVIQGDGVKKLLGTPDISLEDLLVRETAQNSWDAKSGDQSVQFTINVRELSDEVTKLLREHVFTGDAPGTGLSRILGEEGIGAIEVSDRGTVGLGGPVRSDKTIPEGVVKHFIDLVYNIGSTKTGGTSGGTYGFGKTVAYLVSEVGAIVIWSRCRTADGVEDRLIASAIGDVFDADGYRHTGRHWWGRTVNGFPEPVIGDAAATLGKQLFAKTFGGDELGTNILILAPLLGEPGPSDDAAVLADSVLRNLWPKLVQNRSGLAPMQIRVQSQGVDHPIQDPAKHPLYSGAVTCLEALRAVQRGEPEPVSMFKCHVTPIKWRSQTIGHLALTKYPSTGRQDAESSQSVTLMRHDAELVVKRLERGPVAEPGFQWAGVFKPLANHDPAFAKSEPPAHDNWSPESLTDKTQKSQVQVTLRRVRETADAFLQPSANEKSNGSTLSAAGIADGLSGFLGGIAGSAPSPKSGSGTGASGGSRSKTARAVLGDPSRSASDRPGWMKTMVPIQLSGGDPAGSFVRVAVKVGTDGGTDRREQPDFVTPGGWVGSTSKSDFSFVAPGVDAQYWFESREDVAVDVHVAVLPEEPR